MGLVGSLVKIINEFNTPRPWPLLKLKQLYIEHIKYPRFRNKIKKVQMKTAEVLYDHPNYMVFVVTRYITYLLIFCKIFKISHQKYLDAIFDIGVLHFEVEYEEYDNPHTGKEIKVKSYKLIIRAPISMTVDVDDDTNDVFGITTLEVEVDTTTYKIRQSVFDCKSLLDVPTARRLYDKEFTLQIDGKLHNPNYILDHSLLEEDLNVYRLMISQIMIFMGCMLDASTQLYFLKNKSSK